MVSFHKRIGSAFLCFVLTGMLAFAGVASAFGGTTPTGVEIKEFSLLDTAKDVVGSADFTPEGNKDGHFKLSLSLVQETVINAVVLRSTDVYGKDNFQGVWRTNRATTGWLLGIMDGEEIINPGFRKDAKDPVGTFKGTLNWDLYASNNGTIKETQYYVLEIETPEGTVASKPIKYKKPQGGSSSQTPVPNPKPDTNPNPNPDPKPDPKPDPGPVKPLRVAGGMGKIEVSGGTPNVRVTLQEKTDTKVTLVKSAVLDATGGAVFSNLPAGKQYFVYNADGTPNGPVEVAKKDYVLFDAKSLIAKVGYQPYTKNFGVYISGQMLDSSIKSVEFRSGEYKESFDVRKSKLEYERFVGFRGLDKSITLTATRKDGYKEELYLWIEYDLIDDSTVTASKNDDGTWLVQGKYTSPYYSSHIKFYTKIGPNWIYLQDLRTVGKAEPESDDEMILKQNYRDFQVTVPATNEQEVTLMVVDPYYEVLRVPLIAEQTGTEQPPIAITLRMESTKALVNGKEQTLDAAPYYFEGRTMVPLRFIGQALGATVEWDGKNKSITITKDGNKIELQLDKKEAYVKGQPMMLDAPPTAKDGVTMVPLRVVSESLNMQVKFGDGDIFISDKK